MANEAPVLTIKIRPEDSAKAFVFQNIRGESVAIGSKATFEKAVFEHSSLREKLEELKTIGAGALDLSPAQADQAFQKLYQVGKLVKLSLLGDDIAAYAAPLNRVVQEALAIARLRGETAWVHVTSAENDPIAYSIPFELIPFWTSETPPPIAEDISRLATNLDNFLGFSAVVSRDSGNLFTGAPIAREASRLPVKLFHNVTLRNAKPEMDYFAQRREFDVDGPWPSEDVLEEGFADALLEQIFAPHKRFDGSERTLPDQIQHFACHCDTFGAASNHRFILAGRADRPLAMTLDELSLRFGDLAEKKALPGCDMPLIFLNACGASAVDPRQLGSFVRFFLLNRNRGFIGAQTMIPDQLARVFAETFYASLVMHELSVGECVLRARRKIAERHLNLLGLLYMHYGPAELRIASR